MIFHTSDITLLASLFLFNFKGSNILKDVIYLSQQEKFTSVDTNVLLCLKTHLKAFDNSK